MSGRAADESTQLHEDFLHAERLDEKIVRARLEPIDFVRPTIAGRQDQNRQRAAGCAPSLEDLDAGHFRETKIEHGGIIGCRIAQMLPLLPVAGDIDDEMLRPQRARYRVGEREVVLEEQNFYDASATAGAPLFDEA